MNTMRSLLSNDLCRSFLVHEELTVLCTSNGIHHVENRAYENTTRRAQRGDGGKSTAIVQGIVAQRPDVAHIIRHCHGCHPHTCQDFLAKVLIGESAPDVDANRKMPPLKSADQNIRFDSVTDNTQMYIVYSNAKAYPLYYI